MEQEENKTEESKETAGSNLSRGEKRRLQRLEAKKAEKDRKEAIKKEEGKKNFRSYLIIAAIAILLIGGIFSIVKLTSKNYDKFAECLKEKGVVIYGNEWCQYTQKQKSLLGASFSKIDYVICDENKKLCDEKRITITPTWEINGRMVQEVQNPKTLSALTGCPLD